jgi:hypothetical protein
MRKLLIAIVLLGGLASIALCASYGWDQATVLKDQITAAFIYGMVAVFTLVLHLVAFRIWVSGWRRSGAGIGFAAVLAFVMTTFISLGGLASRTDHVVAERQDEIDTKADTKRQIDNLEKERDGLKFRRTTKATVDAAKRAADTAKNNREAECNKRGNNCRQREIDEQTAANALTEAQTNKDATDRFDQIEVDLKRLRSQKGENSVGAAEPMKALLADIMGVKWATLLTAWQKVVFAVIYDICMVASIIGIEVLGHAPARRRRDETDTSAKTQTLNTFAEPAQAVRISEPAPVVIETVAEPVTPAKLPPPPSPKLATAKKERPAGPIPRIMTAVLEPARGQRVELGEAFVRYAAECKAKAREAVPPDVFLDAMARFCKTVGIKTKIISDKLYLLDVQLVATDGKEQIA